MEEQLVHRSGLLRREEFLDLVSAANLIPGPNSTEVALHAGYRLAGWPGLVLAGVCFILPAMTMVLLLAMAYRVYGTLPPVQAMLTTLQPLVVVVVLQALVRLAPACIRTRPLQAITLSAIFAAFGGLHELLVLTFAGLLHALWRIRRGSATAIAPAVLLPWAALPAMPAMGAVPYSESVLFGTFARIGSVLFGSGYVLLAFLRADFVLRLGWLTEAQLLDAVAIGQVTPGPVFTTATFVGYLLGGVRGALLATVGIFLPAFVFVALSVYLLPFLRRSAGFSAFLDGVQAASLALLVVVCVQLGLAAVRDTWTLGVLLGGALLVLSGRLSASLVLLLGAILGVCRGLLEILHN
jgi:chromate transporter